MDDNGDTVRQTQKNRQQHRNTQQQRTGEWSKISTVLKKGQTQKNAAEIFWATAENWVGTTHRNREHNEYSA